jgi:hypothetical protein
VGRVQLLFVPVLCLASISSGGASPPLWNERTWADVQVLSADTLNASNVVVVSSYFRHELAKPTPVHTPTEFLKHASGCFVVRAKFLRRRVTRSSFYGRTPPPPVDSGWITVATSRVDTLLVVTRYSPHSAKHPPAIGDTLRIGLGFNEECDTYPPKGLCCFDRVALEATSDWVRSYWR